MNSKVLHLFPFTSTDHLRSHQDQFLQRQLKQFIFAINTEPRIPALRYLVSYVARHALLNLGSHVCALDVRSRSGEIGSVALLRGATLPSLSSSYSIGLGFPLRFGESHIWRDAAAVYARRDSGLRTPDPVSLGHGGKKFRVWFTGMGVRVFLAPRNGSTAVTQTWGLRGEVTDGLAWPAAVGAVHPPPPPHPLRAPFCDSRMIFILALLLVPFLRTADAFFFVSSTKVHLLLHASGHAANQHGRHPEHVRTIFKPY